MNCHVAPASVDLKTPLPEIDERAFAWSPPPNQTTLGMDGATATAPIASAPTLSVTFVHVVPALAVFHNPPLRDAA
jgi:hypothetical protein